ncbi:uncharacterized protein EDB91DRAFT_1083296 [Suillus paluster]|uniref:uncharacterized protein n=1 Tax=Suillus paluster TaxID=48578 RepID=UPI001B8831D1|nr:uncharacterized protein EDB91DRAFT_1083296 [Suillus paluster]KAG1736626.1 hypothetical protein EDB91DRAFT_1083296 [Suillus paluster]
MRGPLREPHLSKGEWGSHDTTDCHISLLFSPPPGTTNPPSPPLSPSSPTLHGPNFKGETVSPSALGTGKAGTLASCQASGGTCESALLCCSAKVQQAQTPGSGPWTWSVSWHAVTCWSCSALHDGEASDVFRILPKIEECLTIKKEPLPFKLKDADMMQEVIKKEEIKEEAVLQDERVNE